MLTHWSYVFLALIHWYDSSDAGKATKKLQQCINQRSYMTTMKHTKAWWVSLNLGTYCMNINSVWKWKKQWIWFIALITPIPSALFRSFRKLLQLWNPWQHQATLQFLLASRWIAVWLQEWESHCYSSSERYFLTKRPANERCRYIVTTSLIGWAHT